ncbi:unnamed protein product [Echinostoma caproni]|uniref:LIM zinc-binding domain-containing protein n=1 Tax=Echinostoma caproni TaxID=27848 RepID=A0A183APP1_9TREM|nr:unnamed protein product [Echinostoma caproni]
MERIASIDTSNPRVTSRLQDETGLTLETFGKQRLSKHRVAHIELTWCKKLDSIWLCRKSCPVILTLHSCLKHFLGRVIKINTRYRDEIGGISMAIVRCKGCDKQCKGDVLKVKETFFHPDCFQCSACGICLAENGYYFRDNNYYCRKDFKQIFSKLCYKCGSYITSDMVSVLDKYFHHQCFYCHTCQ